MTGLFKSMQLTGDDFAGVKYEIYLDDPTLAMPAHERVTILGFPMIGNEAWIKIRGDDEAASWLIPMRRVIEIREMGAES